MNDSNHLNSSDLSLFRTKIPSFNSESSSDSESDSSLEAIELIDRLYESLPEVQTTTKTIGKVSRNIKKVKVDVSTEIKIETKNEETNRRINKKNVGTQYDILDTDHTLLNKIKMIFFILLKHFKNYLLISYIISCIISYFQ